MVEEMDGKIDWNDAASITTTGYSTEKNTPTRTVVTEDFEEDTYGAKPGGDEAVPWANEKFVIRHRESGQAIAVNDDGDVQLTFLDNVDMRESCHWKCVEKDGWFGFKHEGRYLGHDNSGNFIAEAKRHRAYEYFCTRKHPDGGYQLMVLHGWVFHSMGVKEDGQKLVETEDGGALWDFLKV